MRKECINRLSTEQALNLLELKSFEEDRSKIIELLLTKNYLSAGIFRKLHEDNGCKTESEFIYSKKSGFIDIDFGIDIFPYNFFIRKCIEHGVESSEFVEIGGAPDDWDGVTHSKRK